MMYQDERKKEMMEFKIELYELNGWNILRLPQEISLTLPSRGMVMVQGMLNNIPFETPLEPDGKGSHWFRVTDALFEKAQIHHGDIVSLQIEPMKDWIEAEVPSDLMNQLAHADLLGPWDSLTTKARWEWIRWIRSTSNEATRQKRIGVACSKLQAGMRRPCCFNQNICTEAAVSKNGVLLDPK